MPNPGAASPGADLSVSVAVLLERSDTQGRKLDEVAADVKATAASIASTYATKGELNDVRKDVDGIKSGIGWAVKTVLFVVIVAVLGVVIAKGGVPHP